MVMFNLGSGDKRCVRTCKAIEDAFFCFYARHSCFKQLSISALCRAAKVSTPTFYRHYKNIQEVAEARHQKIKKQLSVHVEKDTTLMVGLIRVFQFVANNRIYYMANVFQMYLKPFEEVKKVLRPKVLKYIKITRKTNRTRTIDDWICYEVEEYTILQLKWWVEREKLDVGKIDEKVTEILIYAKQRIAEADRKLQKDT